MGKMQRTKGKVWERTVAKELRDIFGPQVKRGWQAREGCDAPDIENVPRQWPECKHHKRVNIAAAMRQAEEEYARWLARTLKQRTATPSDCLWPVVYSKSNNEQPFVTMRMGDFLTLLKQWWKLEGLREPPPLRPRHKPLDMKACPLMEKCSDGMLACPSGCDRCEDG
jgi:hypothetical protein